MEDMCGRVRHHKADLAASQRGACRICHAARSALCLCVNIFGITTRILPRICLYTTQERRFFVGKLLKHVFEYVDRWEMFVVKYGITTRVLPRLLIMDLAKEYYLPVPVDVKVPMCLYICVYVYIYMYICVCVCAC